jgi:hypothetical protein
MTAKTEKTTTAKPAATPASEDGNGHKKMVEMMAERQLGKYADKEAKVLAENRAADVDPHWEGRTKVFVAGPNQPKSPNSRMGVLYSFVKEAGTAGITGEELASKMRHHKWDDSRSKYNLGLPPIGWAEDYVKGAASNRLRHIKENVRKVKEADRRDTSDKE